ncbi:hypothetical protein GCM10023075_68970 [Streptosporangium album]
MDSDGFSMFRTRETRLGPGVRCTPGTAVLTRPETLPGRRLPPLNGRSPTSRFYFPSRDVDVTKHQREFTVVRPIQPSSHL